MMLLLLITLTGFEYLLVDPVAERAGMGYALYGDGHNIYYNPAGIVLNTGTTYSISYLNYIGGTHFGYLDYESSLLGTGLRYFYSGKMKKTDALGQELGDFSTNFIDLNIGKGYTMGNIILGASGKIVYEQIDTLSSLGIGADIGALYFLTQKNIQFGLAVKNLGVSVKPFIKERETFPYEFNLGVVRRFYAGWIAMDITHSAFMNFGVRLGGEYSINQFFRIRASYNSLLSEIKTDNGIDFIAGITFGFGVSKGKIQVNYSYSPYFALGQAHRLTLRIGG
ncbi:MAG: PorV/PorQ family protein [bacterium]